MTVRICESNNKNYNNTFVYIVPFKNLRLKIKLKQEAKRHESAKLKMSI